MLFRSFIFLQDFKSTLIPAIAVPVSIIGTFFFLNVLGYSINLLTLFALILAIGIVVDDAIVVVEAVHAKLEGGYKSAKKASISAMNEITGAIVSITLVMMAVFIPITFIKGPSGVFYEQFGVTLMIAIFISAVNALTLTPALCAIFLKPHQEETGKKKSLLKRFYGAFNAGFDATLAKYSLSLGFLIRHKWITFLILGGSVVSIVYVNSIIPSGFVPSEDRGVIYMNAELPPGSSQDRAFRVNEQLHEIIKNIDGVKGASLISGRNFFSGAGSSNAMGFIILEPWKDRESQEKSVNGIMQQLFKGAATIPDAKIIFFTPPSVPGFGSADGFEMSLLDRASRPLTQLDETATDFVRLLNQQPEIAYASNSFSTNFPQLELDINVERAKESGVSTSAILSALQGYIGGNYVADFSRFGKQFRVFVQALPEDRIDEASLNSMRIRTPSGEMTPISQFVSFKRVYGPQTINRFNLFNAVTINGSTQQGFSSGDVIKTINELAETSLPEGYQVAYTGITREEIASSGQSTIIFMISILFVYFLLSAQYESYLLPLVVILSLPIGIAGAYFTTYLTGLENNIYFQIALIMLIGLLAKNAILIVEFAVQRRQQGLSLIDAAIDGAKVRLRPILMTSFAFILGITPLALAKGVGASGNNSIGTGAVGGLLIGTIIGVFVIPVLFVVFQWMQEKITGVPQVTNKEIKE